MKNSGIILLFCVYMMMSGLLSAQQFNSDNYVTMPYGVSTFCLVAGQRSSLILPSFSIIPKWEFFIGASLFWKDDDRRAEDHFQTIIYAKYMIFENKTKTGGAAVSFGTGGFPGYYQKQERIESFRNYYVYFPVTFPFFNSTLSWDLNPGVLLDKRGGVNEDEFEWGFTYSTRLAIYKIIPKTAIVGEVYGTAGQIDADPEYNLGLRWEPHEQLNVSLTWGDSFDGSRGPGFQLGMLLYTSRFICKGCKSDIF